MTGRVSTSGKSRWSRSVAIPTTSVANQAPNSASASGSSANRIGRTAKANAPKAAQTAVRQPIGRPAGTSSSCSGQRVASRSARTPKIAPTAANPSPSGVIGGPPRRRLRPYASRAPARASSTSVAWVTPVAPRAANGSRLAEVARAADVEMGPRHRRGTRAGRGRSSRASPRPSPSSGDRRTSSPCPARSRRRAGSASSARRPCRRPPTTWSYQSWGVPKAPVMR